MATTKRERVSNSSSDEDTDVVESDGVDRNIGVIRRPKRKFKKVEKQSRPIPPPNSPAAAGTSKSSDDASSSAKKPPKEEEDNEDERCPICLCEFGPEVAFPDSCEHKFCSGCILEWAKKVNTCPIDRSEFKYVLILNRDSSEVCERIEISKRFPKVPLANLSPATSCIICGLEENLLTCCECYLGFHSSCLFLSIENDHPQGWRCPYCVFREAHDGLAPVQYASPSQLRLRQYERAQEYLQRVNRMYGVNSQEEEPLFAPPTRHLPSSVHLPEPDRPPVVEANTQLSRLFRLPSAVETSSDESDEVAREAESVLSFFRTAVQMLEAPARSPSTSSSSATSDDSSSEVEEDAVTESSGTLLNPITVSSGDSSDDEFSSFRTSNDLNEEFPTSQQQRPHQGSNISANVPSAQNLPARSRPRLSPEDVPEIIRDLIAQGERLNSNAVPSGHGNGSSRHPNDPIENPLRSHHESSQSAVPYIYSGESTTAMMNQGTLRSSRTPLLSQQNAPEVLEDSSVIEEDSHRDWAAMYSGRGSNNSRRPNGQAESPYGSIGESRRQFIGSTPTPERRFERLVFLNRMRRRSNFANPPRFFSPPRPPQDDPEILADTHVTEERGGRNSTALHSWLGSNNNRRPSDLAENPYRNLHLSRQSTVANVPAGRNILRFIRMRPVPMPSSVASTTPQLPPPVTRTAVRENPVALLRNIPSVITRSCISHTNQINTVPENSSSSIQRSPARPTMWQPLIVPKPSPSNSSSTTNGS